MRKTMRRVAVLAIWIVWAGGSTLWAAESVPAEQVKTALSSLHQWLGTGSRAAGWKKFLKSNELTAQLAKGSDADKSVVQGVLATYSGPTPGLDKPRFAAVRTALTVWLAEFSLPEAEELPAVARAAAGQLTPVDPQRLAKSKAKVAAAAAKLDAWLARGGAKSHTIWKTFLTWDDLQKLVAADAAPDAKAVEDLWTKFRSNETGLESARFMALRDALREYAYAATHTSQEKLQTEYPKQVEELALRLEAYAKTGAGEDAATAGRLVAWLEQAGQAPALVAGVRGNFNRDNLLATVSARLIYEAINEDVNSVMPIQDNILGTDIEGVAHTRGRLNARLLPSTDSAALEIILSGSTYSDTVGYQGPVTIYSEGNTSVFARKRLFINALGLRTRPAEASCATASNINDISARLRLIERIAWRKAGKSKSLAEEIASGKAEVRVCEQMDSRVAELVEQSNETFVGKLRNPLVRRGEFPRRVVLSTSAERLNLRVLHRNAAQLAAPSAPTPIEGGHDIGLAVHESLVSNFAEGAIGGETLTDKMLADLMREATGTVPEELQLSPDKDPWSITFHAEQPILVAFANETVRIGIRGQRFTRAETAIKEAVQISAVYKIERTGVGAKFVRQGDVAVDFIKPGRLSVTQIAFKTFMRRKFEALFKPEFDRQQNGLQLPGRFQQVGALEVVALTAGQGWLRAGWKIPDKARTAQVNSQ